MKGVIKLGILMMVLVLAATSIYAQSETPKVSITLLEYTPTPVQPGQVMDVILELDNAGGIARDASLEIVEDYPFILEFSQDVEIAKDLGSIGFDRKLQFRVRIADDAQDGLTPLRVRYRDNSLSGGFLEETFDINIQTFDARIDIVKIEQIPERIAPGDTGQLVVHLQNADDKPLQNVDVVLDLTDTYSVDMNMDNTLAVQAMINARLEQVNRRVASGLSPLVGLTPMMNGGGMGEIPKTEFKAFSTVGSSNKKSVALLKAKTRSKITFDIIALPDASSDVYATPLYLSYNDEDNNPYHIRVDIPLIVDAEPELYIELKETSLRTPDFASDVTFTVANRGLSDAKYVTLALADHESVAPLTAPNSVYLGDLKPGDVVEGTFTVLAHDREIVFPITANYRDAYNKKVSHSKEIEFSIINRNYHRDLPYEMWIAWLILGLVVLALTAFYVWHMSKKE